MKKSLLWIGTYLMIAGAAYAGDATKSDSVTRPDKNGNCPNQLIEYRGQCVRNDVLNYLPGMECGMMSIPHDRLAYTCYLKSEATAQTIMLYIWNGTAFVPAHYKVTDEGVVPAGVPADQVKPLMSRSILNKFMPDLTKLTEAKSQQKVAPVKLPVQSSGGYADPCDGGEVR